MVAEVTVVAGVRPSGDFEAFIAARARILWRAAWLLTGDHQRAEDLVQAALAKAYPHYQRLGDDEAFEAYLRTTMYHTYLSWWRRRWTGEVPGEVRGGTSIQPDVALHHDITRALAELPRQQRAVVVLTYFEDLSHPRTAEVLGISVGTVKSTLARALAKLRVSPRLEGER